jgi:lysophospholipase L1-like esterase
VGLVVIGLTLVAPAAAGAGTGNGILLGTGDSIAFGTNIALDPSNAANFTGYPTNVGNALGLDVTNTACPGETSSHFVSESGADLVCGQYRATFPLHTSYSGSQLAFTTSFLQAHRNTQVVTIDIGANDLFRLDLVCLTSRTTFTFNDIAAIALAQNSTPTAAQQQCIQNGLTQTLATLGANLDVIYGTWRRAGYFGPIVAVTVYSTNFANQTITNLAVALDTVIVQQTLLFGGRVADGFGAFKAAAAGSGGDACAAGLLNRLPASLGVGCDVHPSPKGQQALANAVLAAL